MDRAMFSAIVVLANEMDQNGVLNNESKARMDCGIAAFNAGEAPYMVTCGWAYRVDFSLPIAQAMLNYAVASGIPRASMIMETKSRDTVGDAVFTCRDLARPRGWRSLLVVTSQYHTRRVAEIFAYVYGEACSIEVRGAPSDDNETLRMRELRSTAAFRETFMGVRAGNLAEIFARLNEEHPLYNVTRHPTVN